MMMRNAKSAPARPQVAPETPVIKATSSMLAKMDAQRAEITRLLRAVQAALA
jgi:hypothetical protein